MKTFILNSKFLILISAVFLVLVLYIMSNKAGERRILRINEAEISVEIADNLPEQARGLAGRDRLCENCGMLFTYRQAQIQNFWMKGMKFPLDIIFIKQNKIVDIAENVPVPDKEVPQVTSKQEADMVLEVNAGFVRKHLIKTGDALTRVF